MIKKNWELPCPPLSVRPTLQSTFLIGIEDPMCPSAPSGLLSWDLIRHTCKRSDWGQEWLWTRETQWNQILDLGLISNGIKPIELIGRRRGTLRQPTDDARRVIKIIGTTSVMGEARLSRVKRAILQGAAKHPLCSSEFRRKQSTVASERSSWVGVGAFFKCNFSLFRVLRIYLLK